MFSYACEAKGITKQCEEGHQVKEQQQNVKDGLEALDDLTQDTE